jgi:4-hydroxy-4-methyl-2-oxoglutarate aldolase
MVHVITKVPRPGRKLIEPFSTIGAATVYEASGRQGSIDPRIKPLSRGMRVLGPAVTVECYPKDNLMLHKALQIAEGGDVLVASTQGYPDAGYWGGLMATSAVARKLGGLVIDGCVRDSAEIAEMGFPVFCLGTCMRGTIKGNLGRVNHPLLVGEVLVHPGDLVLGDDDGLVVVAREKIEAVLEASRARIGKEEEKAEGLAKGISSVELNKLDAVFQALGLVEE